MATTRRKSKKKLSPLKLGAIVLLGGGVGYLLWKKLLQPSFFKDEEQTNLDVTETETENKDVPTIPAPPKVETPQKPKIELDKKIKKGDKGDLVYRVQIAINNIAKLRGRSYWWDKDKNKNVNFPLPHDPIKSEFADRTDSGAKFAFPTYRNSGYITLRKAREQWARSAGYFNKPFPTELVGVSNYLDLKKIYDYNKVKKEANDESFWTKDLGFGITIF